MKTQFHQARKPYTFAIEQCIRNTVNQADERGIKHPDVEKLRDLLKLYDK